jgi:hypothetical protein
LKTKLHKGKYIIALEIFWEQTEYQNVSLSLKSARNDNLELKLTSLGSNFDIMVYKAFLNFYLCKYQGGEVGNESAYQKIKIEPKPLRISEKILKVIKKEKIVANFEVVEILTGFFMLYGGIVLQRGELTLVTDPQFIKENFIRAPELISLLGAHDLKSYNLVFDENRSLMFLIVRTNLKSTFRGKAPIRINRYFSQAKFSPAEDSKRPFTPDDHLMSLYYEKFIFRKQLEYSPDCPFLTDFQCISNLSKKVYNRLKGDCLEQLNRDKDKFCKG